MEESLRERDFMQWLQIFRVVQERPADRPARRTESLFREILRKDHGIVPLAVALGPRRVRVRYLREGGGEEAIWEVQRWASDLLIEAIRRDPRYGAVFPEEVAVSTTDTPSDFLLPEDLVDEGGEAEFVPLEAVLAAAPEASEDVDDGQDSSAVPEGGGLARKVSVGVDEVEDLGDELPDHRQRDEVAEDGDDHEKDDRRPDRDPEAAANPGEKVHPDHPPR
ncbi:MAG: hypothetical protein KM296_09530 [Brockia lithotrophica]|nr:hypothetical protein [Brockia lithotrophica]